MFEATRTGKTGERDKIMLKYGKSECSVSDEELEKLYYATREILHHLEVPAVVDMFQGLSLLVSDPEVCRLKVVRGSIVQEKFLPKRYPLPRQE